MEDIFAIQDDVAGAITSELKLRLAPPAERPTDSTDAYALYLEAVAMSDFPDGDITDAIALLDRAIELDPGFAKAYELKALSYWLAGGWTISSSAAQPLVYQSAMKALELDPTLVSARSFSVSADPDNWSWVREIEAIEEAAAAAPNDIRILDSLAYDFTQTGYFAAALSYARRIIEVDPLSPLGYQREAMALSALGRRDESRSGWNRAAELHELPVEWIELLDRVAHGEYESAITGLESAFQALGLDPAEARPFIQSASNPATGKEFLAGHIKDTKESNANVEEITTAQFWYLAFGYVEEYWQEIEDTAAQSTTSWTDADVLEHACRVLAITGCAASPRAIAYAEQNQMIELWEKRGPPDRCSKDRGAWICE